MTGGHHGHHGYHGQAAAARQAVRATTHLAIWTAFAVPTIVQMAQGWRSLGDNAYVSFRAYQVFSLHIPLVGTWSSASSPVDHTFYCLGPLWFWLIALPVRLDPEQGALWGSALMCAVALSLAAEAAWAAKGWKAGAAVGLVVVDLLWLTPQLFADPPWNAFFGLFVLVATVVLAWVVATGSLGWWPVLVLVGSVDVQAHMFFVITAGVLTLGAPLVGLARRGWPGRARWLVGGLLVGVACWAAPVVQEATGHPGNVTLLVTSGHGGPSVGIGFGFRMLADAGSLPPIWLRHYPTSYLADYFIFIRTHAPVAGGLVIMGGLVLVGVVAWLAGHRDLATLAAIGAVCSLGLVASMASLPVKNVGSVAYLAFSLWVVGIVLWIVGGWSVAVVVAAALRRLPTAAGASIRHLALRARSWLAPWSAAAVVAVIVAVGVLGIHHPPTSPFTAQDQGAVTQVANITAAIEHAVPRGPVAFELHLHHQVLADESLPAQTVRDATSVVWQLTADGWQTGIPSALRATSDPFGAARPGWPMVVVTLDGNTVTSAVLYDHRRPVASPSGTDR